MTRNTKHRIASVVGGLLLLTGITLGVICLVTNVWDGKWVLAVWLVLGSIGITAWSDGPELTR